MKIIKKGFEPKNQPIDQPIKHDCASCQTELSISEDYLYISYECFYNGEKTEYISFDCPVCNTQNKINNFHGLLIKLMIKRIKKEKI